MRGPNYNACNMPLTKMMQVMRSYASWGLATWAPALFGVLLIPALAYAQAGDSLRSLYDQHRFFELRDAIKGQSASALYLGTVASAFNDTKRAERYLNRVIKLDPASDNAYEAHEQLANLFARLGRNREVVQQLDQMLAMKPNSSDVQSDRPIFAGFSRYPDQSIGKKRSTRISGGTVSKESLAIPVSVHGKALNWGLDSGANISVISEAEAKMLGLTVGNEKVQMNDLNGGSAAVRTTVVDRLSIGGWKYEMCLSW